MSKTILDIRFEAAILEIVAEAQLPLNKGIVETWLCDYQELWEAKNREFHLPPLEMLHGRNMTEFDDIYRLLRDIKAYYRLNASCAVAMAEYRLIMANNTPSDDRDYLKDWIARYEKLGTDDLLIPPIYPDSLNFVKTIYGVTYFIAGSEFKNIADFYEVFSNVYAWE